MAIGRLFPQRSAWRSAPDHAPAPHVKQKGDNPQPQNCATGIPSAAKSYQFVAIVAPRFGGTLSVNGSRIAALCLAGFAGILALHLSRASAQWWHRAPADFEDCAAAAEK